MKQVTYTVDKRPTKEVDGVTMVNQVITDKDSGDSISTVIGKIERARGAAEFTAFVLNGDGTYGALAADAGKSLSTRSRAGHLVQRAYNAANAPAVEDEAPASDETPATDEATASDEDLGGQAA